MSYAAEVSHCVMMTKAGLCQFGFIWGFSQPWNFHLWLFHMLHNVFFSNLNFQSWFLKK